MAAYWLGIMAVVLASALALWLILVLRADRKLPEKPQAMPPPREIVGGIFQAGRGGRQLMPDPNEPIRHDPGWAEAEQPIPERPRGGSPDARAPDSTPATAQVTGAKVPEQRNARLREQSPASGSAGNDTGGRAHGSRASGTADRHPGR
jgi:hypothetical protein